MDQASLSKLASRPFRTSLSGQSYDVMSRGGFITKGGIPDAEVSPSSLVGFQGFLHI